MRVTKYENQWIYESTRKHDPQIKSSLIVEIGDQLSNAEPGTWEFFVIERYLLYASREDKLFTGMVHHSPYSLRQARLVGRDDALVRAAGITPGLWRNTLYSPGVDVEVFGIQGVNS